MLSFMFFLFLIGLSTFTLLGGGNTFLIITVLLIATYFVLIIRISKILSAKYNTSPLITLTILLIPIFVLALCAYYGIIYQKILYGN